MGKTVAICQVGGELVENDDGSVSYTGGEAYAIPVIPNMSFDEFKSEIADMCNRDPSKLIIKYLLPSNRRTPITISNDKHMQRMIDFHEDSASVEVFVVDGDAVTPKTVTALNNRESKGRSETTTRPSSRTKKGASATDSIKKGPSSRTKRRASATDSIYKGPSSRTKRGASATDSINKGRDIRITTVTDPVTPSPTAASFVAAGGDSIAVGGDSIAAGGDSIASRTRSRITSANPVTPVASAFAPTGYDESPLEYSSNEDIITGVGQEFESANNFHDSLRRHCIAQGFLCVYIENNPNCVTAKCKAEGCPWRVHASKISTFERFKVETMDKLHTCGCGVGKESHPYKRKGIWIESIIKNKLQDSPQCTVKEIMEDIYREYGVSLKYHQAWRRKELAQYQLQDSRAEVYAHLPWFCERIKEINPGSIVTLVTTDESRFHRLFFSFHASLHGFEIGCRPLIMLDAASLREKYQGTLLTAASVDGDDGIFPIAFAIVDSESYDDWRWFLAELKLAVPTNKAITFVSNRHNGLEEAVPQVFEGSYHSYSLDHLTEDFKQVFQDHSQMKDLVDEFKRAALSCSLNDFNVCIDSIRNISHDVATWILNSKPEHWSNALFRGSRYNHVSSNIAGLFREWMSEEKQVSIIQMVDRIRVKIMDMIHERREASSTWSTILTPSMEQRLQLEIQNSHALHVLCLSGSVFEVRDNSVNNVDVEALDCTCQGWKLSGLPCIHAAAVFDRMGRNIYEYCSKYFTVDCYRSAYSESVHPIPDIGNPVSEDSSVQMIVHPPRIQRPRHPPSRPKTKQLVNPRTKLLHHCGNCGQEGHNKRRCKGPPE